MNSQDSIPTPCRQTVMIQGQSYNLIAFYYPDQDTSWDCRYQAQFLSNFYPCKLSLTLEGMTGRFRTSEAAYQSLKWWYDAEIRSQFEQAQTGTEAYELKKTLPNMDHTYGGLGRDGAMRAVLTEKFNQPLFQEALLLTEDAYLVEHNAKVGRDLYWSDNGDGSGANKLGQMLMEIREFYGGMGVPRGNYHLADFVRQIL